MNRKRLLIRSQKAVFIISAFFIGFLLIYYARPASEGIKKGIELLLYRLIPSLFPFMVFSCYISASPPALKNNGLITRAAEAVFRTNGYCILPFLLGILGGYPAGAAAISDLKGKNVISQNDAEHMFYWCINPSPAFTVTAVGTFLLKNTQIGLILYFSCIFASLTVGFLCRFIKEGAKKFEAPEKTSIKPSSRLVQAVSSAGSSLLGMSGWVLCFSALSSCLCSLFRNKGLLLAVKLLSEVTAGCEEAVLRGISLPVIAALLSFGGFAVVCQISAFGASCSVQMRRIFCSRLINAVFSALYCEFLLKLFPQSRQVFSSITAAGVTFPVYHSFFAAAVLVIMFAVLILEVDKEKKLC